MSCNRRVLCLADTMGVTVLELYQENGRIRPWEIGPGQWGSIVAGNIASLVMHRTSEETYAIFCGGGGMGVHIVALYAAPPPEDGDVGPPTVALLPAQFPPLCIPDGADRATAAPPNFPVTMLDVSSCCTYIVASIPVVATPSNPHIHVYASADMSPYEHCWSVPPGHSPGILLCISGTMRRCTLRGPAEQERGKLVVIEHPLERIQQDLPDALVWKAYSR